MRPLFATSFVVLFSYSATAQNLESFGKQKPFSISGGVSLNQVYYASNDKVQSRDPYSYFANGNLNLSIYGWSVPLAFGFSNQKATFQQPFNQYSLHPSYKSITAHVGFTSVTFSPYTVSGHSFLGGAVDYAPEGRWKLSALYGKFLKAVEHDTSRTDSKPAFQRMGYGVKASYQAERDLIELTMFRAADDLNSIKSLPDTLNIFPQENLVVSVGGTKSLFGNFSLRAEAATTAISSDSRAELVPASGTLKHSAFIYRTRTSSSTYNALKGSLQFQEDGFVVGVTYERIDPGYRTLGAYYFNNDIENITFNVASSLLNRKMNISVNGGSQRDNIDYQKSSTMRRVVGSLNVSFVPTDRLNLSGSYSNFQTYTNIRSQFQQINQVTPYENLDTLNFTQISQNAALNASYVVSASKEKRQNVNLNLTVQDAADKQADVAQNSGMRFYNFAASYSVNLAPKNMSLSVSLNSTISEGAGVGSRTIGPTVSLSRSFFDKKLKTIFSSAYNSSTSNGNATAANLNTRLSASTSVRKKHNVNLAAMIMHRLPAAATSSTALTLTLGYGYSFSR